MRARLASPAMAILVHGPIDPDPAAKAQYDSVQQAAGRLRSLTDGLIAHIAIDWADGFQVMGVWESHAAERAAHTAPRVAELRGRMGLPPLEISAPVRVHNIRTRDFNIPVAASRYHHVALSVADLDACVAWYESKLGFLGFREVRRLDPVPGTPGLRMAVVKGDPVAVELLEHSGAKVNAKASSRSAAQQTHAFVVDDAERVHALLRDNGVRVSEDQPAAHGGPALRSFSDLEGNLFEISSSR
jgi:catechol 2,3-dioxygenase-like lactoylglutathione lyase family enzyme